VPHLRIVFDKPGFFIVDVRLLVTFDGRTVHDGSFMSGFDVSDEVAAGPHRIATEIAPFKRRKTYDVTIGDAPSYTARLRYSRFWGNFTGKIQLTPG